MLHQVAVDADLHLKKPLPEAPVDKQASGTVGCNIIQFTN